MAIINNRKRKAMEPEERLIKRMLKIKKNQRCSEDDERKKHKAGDKRRSEIFGSHDADGKDHGETKRRKILEVTHGGKYPDSETKCKQERKCMTHWTTKGERRYEKNKTSEKSKNLPAIANEDELDLEDFRPSKMLKVPKFKKQKPRIIEDERFAPGTIKLKNRTTNKHISENYRNDADDRKDNDESDNELSVSINDVPSEIVSSFSGMSISQEKKNDSEVSERPISKEINVDYNEHEEEDEIFVQEEKTDSEASGASERRSSRKVHVNYNERDEDDETVSESSYNPKASDTDNEDDFFDPQDTGKSRGTDLEDTYDDYNDSPCKKRHKRYVRSISSKARLERKKALNSGKSYVNSRGNTVRSRECKKLPDCRMKCAQKLSSDICQHLHEEYWKIADIDLQRLYVSPLISVTQKKTERTSQYSPSKQRNRVESRKFHVSVKGAIIQVCKGCFQNIFDVSNRFIDTVVRKKLINPAGVPERDQRGRKAPPQKLTKEKLIKVREHISSFPAYESHYSRKKTSKKYLASHLTLATMYQLYQEKYPTDKLSRFIYEREFHSMGLSFKEPKTDTCKICDKLKIMLINAKDDDEKAYVQEQIEAHQKIGNAPYDAKDADKKRAQNSKGSSIVATFDMQQCLPTPNISTSVVFYSRQLWTYNLTCHNCNNGKSYNYMWHEGVASRGANQVASAVFQFLMGLPDSVTDVIFYSDSCCGQNKNGIISAMFMYALQNKDTLKVIDHKFLTPGHTRNECDSDHAAIERVKKRKGHHIEVPRDYYNMIRNMGKRYEVMEMYSRRQYNFAALLNNTTGPLKKPVKNVSGKKFLWRAAQWFRYKRTTLGLVQYKESMNEEEKFSIVDFRRRKMMPRLKVSQLHHGPQPINEDKKKDLLNLFPYIDEDSRIFYTNLMTEEIPLTDPDIFSSDDDDSDN